MIDFLTRYSAAISFTIVFTGFIINLLLGIFVKQINNKANHLSMLSALFFTTALCMLSEGLSYVSAILELGAFSMRFLTVCVVFFTTLLGYIYYAYLLSYYEYKKNEVFPKAFTYIPAIYSLLFAITYAVLSPTGILFDVTPTGRYMVTNLSFIPFVMLLPLMILSLFTIYKGRLLTSKAISICFFVGVATIYVSAGFDSITGISFNFLWKTIMNLILYYAIMRDQDEELAKAIKTEQTSRARSEFLTNMSHDIRTPMNAVLGFTELAKREIDKPEIIKDYLDKISMSGEYLLSLINDVLDMSRIENEGIFLEEAPTEISAILYETQTIIAARVAKKSQHFSIIKSDFSDYRVLADKLRIKQILINVLGNAVKYTPEGGEISLRVSSFETGIPDYLNYVFVIKDNGIGMEEDFIKHIFEPFSRERSSTVCKQQGTGLGLAITRGIVDSIGGNISVESRIGKGSTFTITLPLKTCHDFNPCSSALSPVNYDFKGTRILLAEDNELNIIIAKKLLTDKNIEVIVAKNGEEALNLIERNFSGYFNAILMDIQMPVMNGYEATKAIRSLTPEKSDIPIIAMSASVFKEDIDTAMKCGMNGYIKKPIVLDELYSTLKCAIGSGSIWHTQPF